MKLYNVNVSPYCARVRYFIYSRHIPCDIVEHDRDLQGFREASPLGKVPALVTDRGTFVFESEAINEYFAEVCRPPIFVPLLPETPEERAHSRAVSRLVDVYISPVMSVLWTKSTPEELSKAVEAMDKAFDAIETQIVGPLATRNRHPVLADLAIGSTLVYFEVFGGRIKYMPLELRPKLRLLYETMLKDVDFQKIRKEMVDGIATMRQAAKKARM